MSPRQYGFVSTKHLCRIEVHSGPATSASRSVADRLLEEHPRARVWEEERHARVPGRAVRTAYRLLIPPIRYLSARGAESTSGGSVRALTD